MKQDLTPLLQTIYDRYKNMNEGSLPTYIPELTKADPSLFAISIVTVEGDYYSVGQKTHPFTIQSISKPLIHGLGLEHLGSDKILEKIGVEPTGDPYNSIKLQPYTYRPYNPMVNAGAIALCSMIPGNSYEDKMQVIEACFNAYAGRSLEIDMNVFLSEKIFGHHNRAMAYLMLNFNVIKGSVESILDCYFRSCSYLITVKELAMIGATLANKGVNPATQTPLVSAPITQKMLAVMMSCGLYDFAGEWSYTVGFPAKSGVSGGILGVIPGKMGIGVFSPLLDHRGNSVRGIKVCQDLSQELALSIF